MFGASRWFEGSKFNPWRRLWEPFWRTISSAKGSQRRLLLANYASRCPGVSAKVRPLPTLQACTGPACQRVTSTNKSLAVHAMGDRPGWAHAARCWGQRNDDRGNRLFHQVGRSGVHDNNNSDGHRALHIEEHHLPFWYPWVHRHLQWPVIYGQRFGGVLPKIRYKATHVHTKISARQWAIWSFQQDDPRLPQKIPSPIKKESGQMHSPDVCGRIVPPKGEQPEKPLSLWRSVRKQSFIPTSSCQASPPWLPDVEQNSEWDAHKPRPSRGNARADHSPHRILPAAAPL